MSRWELEPSPLDAGRRIDAYLARCGTHSRSALARMLDEGRVLCDGRRVSKSYRLTGVEAITVELPDTVPDTAVPEDIPLDVTYEDGDLLVINKPRGLVVHPAPGHAGGTLVNALLHHCGGQLSGIGGVARPGIVHRLDKDTSGLMLAAKNDFTHRRLAAALGRREISRTYMAIVCGCPEPPDGTADAPVGRHPAKRTRMAVVGDGRPARTRYSVLEVLRGCSLVRCELETGRTHQIRVHMSWLGHPVLGDTLYGGRQVKGSDGQLLHACSLSFTHPRTGERMSFDAPPPEVFARVLNGLRQHG